MSITTWDPISGTTILRDWGSAVFDDLTAIDARLTPAEPIATAWTTYTPTWSASSVNPALGNGTISGKYKQVGKTIWWRIVLVPGGTTTFGTGAYSFTLPVAPIAADYIAGVVLNDVSASLRFDGQCWIISAAASGDIMRIIFSGESPFANMTQASPITFASGDRLILQGEYEIA